MPKKKKRVYGIARTPKEVRALRQQFEREGTQILKDVGVLENPGKRDIRGLEAARLRLEGMGVEDPPGIPMTREDKLWRAETSRKPRPPKRASLSAVATIPSYS